MTHRLIRISEVRARTGLSRSCIYRNIEAGKFPPPIKIGTQATAWIESAVDAWIEQRILSHPVLTPNVSDRQGR